MSFALKGSLSSEESDTGPGGRSALSPAGQPEGGGRDRRLNGARAAATRGAGSGHAKPETLSHDAAAQVPRIGDPLKTQRDPRELSQQSEFERATRTSMPVTSCSRPLPELLSAAAVAVATVLQSYHLGNSGSTRFIGLSCMPFQAA